MPMQCINNTFIRHVAANDWIRWLKTLARNIVWPLGEGKRRAFQIQNDNNLSESNSLCKSFSQFFIDKISDFKQAVTGDPYCSSSPSPELLMRDPNCCSSSPVRSTRTVIAICRKTVGRQRGETRGGAPIGAGGHDHHFSRQRGTGGHNLGIIH